MKFASVRVVANKVDALIDFYERLSQTKAVRMNPEFAEVRLEGAILAISSEELIRKFNAGAATAAINRSAILEF